jgi:hypothetical protein
MMLMIWGFEHLNIVEHLSAAHLQSFASKAGKRIFG